MCCYYSSWAFWHILIHAAITSPLHESQKKSLGHTLLAAGAHLLIRWIFERAKRPDDKAD